MVVVPDSIKNQLKNPLGELHQTEFLLNLKDKKIISVGDVSTLNCLKYGIKPYIAVFDFKFMRTELTKKDKDTLLTAFPNLLKIKNEPGTISTEFLSLARDLCKNSGAVLVEGEEDLTALVFMALNTDFYIVYGQPNEGMVVIKPEDSKIREKAQKILKEIKLF